MNNLFGKNRKQKNMEVSCQFLEVVKVGQRVCLPSTKKSTATTQKSPSNKFLCLRNCGFQKNARIETTVFHFLRTLGSNVQLSWVTNNVKAPAVLFPGFVHIVVVEME
jgi:hypothetical protein